MIVLVVADRDRPDWIAGPSLLLLYYTIFPVHLMAFAASWSRENGWLRFVGVVVGVSLLAFQVVLFVLYVRGGSA